MQEGQFSKKTYLAKNVFKVLITLSLLLSLFPSCKPDNLTDGVEKRYFDIKTYFEQNAKRLTAQHHDKVNKTVVHNGESESKAVTISNWQTEFALFAESDINKPAWRESYNVENAGNAVVYTARYPELKTRRIVISKTEKGGVKQIEIDNEIDNALYTTREKLIYFPDSAYSIEKYQKVALLGANNYKITGRLISGGR